jgi:hypothetical protein
LDLCYVDNWSLRLDLSILAKAFVLLFRRDGVYFEEQGAGSVEHGAESEEVSAKGKRGEYRAGRSEVRAKRIVPSVELTAERWGQNAKREAP